MYYKRGKGAKVYRSSGLRNYGCLMSIFLIPLQVIWVAMKQIIDFYRRK